MQTLLYRKAGLGRALWFSASLITFTSTAVLAQTNFWINPGSGNWEDATNWSLGSPPGSGQTVLVANHGWKAVAIDNNTAANFPQTMSIASLTVISPGTDTVNTVLMNYAGLQTPLAVSGDLYVSNSADMTILDSAVQQTNGTFAIGGTVTEDVSSQVSTEFFEILGGGIYNLNDGTLTVPRFVFENVDAGGQFNLSGGSNSCYALHVNGEYDISGGQLVLPPPGTPDEGILDLGTISQSGGTMDSVLYVGECGVAGGTYQLSGGFFHTIDLEMPVIFNGDEGTTPDTNYVIQTGGTNEADSIGIGVDNFGDPRLGVGYYMLTNGLLNSSTVTITGQGNFYQYGGVHSNASMILSQSELMILVPPYTNYYVPGHYYLNGGTLTSDSVSGQPGAFSQTGGSAQITTLGISGGQYSLSGGQLTVSNIGLASGASFLQTGGTVTQTGTLTLAASGLTAGPGPQQFGQLLVSGSTNSTLTLSAGASALHFANSSGLAWSNATTLIISNWNGSPSGGGSQQIYFGSDSTGLLSQQLSQVQFVIGTNSHPAKILNTGEVVPNEGSSNPGLVNSWINPGSGSWDDATSWSLGVLPNSSQSVQITNSNWKAVAINPSTPTNFPASMTVSNLFIQGSTNTENTLLLNYFGTAVPLTVLNGLTLQDNTQILNFNSGLIVQSGTITVTNSQINQDGGFINTTNAQMNLSDSVYNLTNGVFEAGTVAIGNPTSSHFNQYGGTAIITNLGLGSTIVGTVENGISLYGGTLELPGGMLVYGQQGGVSYFQSGGTNLTTDVRITPNYGGFVSSFTLNGGLLSDSSVELMAGYKATISIGQNGGSHVVANTLFIAGSSPDGFSVDPATYNLNGGTLTAGTIELDADEGDSVFVQSNATTVAGTVYAHSVGYYSSHNTIVTLTGGTLSCSNYTTADGGGQLNQSGGALAVSNLLDFGGFRNVGSPSGIYGTYTFAGGTLTASNINMTGSWIIGDGSTNRISNSGYFSLSHLLQISNAVEQLGQFILASNATINLAGSASELSFAKSSGESWTGGATLVVSNWNGNLSGGGAEQLKFGTDQAGLTSAQLNQIQFSIGTNSYPAKILNTGEVVPNEAGTPPPVTFSTQGKNLILSWPSGYTLQTATNVTGPYTDVSGATSPYTNDMTLDRQRFFRLAP